MLLSKGLDTEKVRRLGNWQTDAMVRRYQHLKPISARSWLTWREFPKTKGTSSRKGEIAAQFEEGRLAEET